MDRLIDRIVALLEANVKTPRGIKAVYKGDIFLIPKSSIPAIMVSPNRTEVRTAQNTQDFNVFTIDITVVLDARDYFNTSPTEFTGLFTAALIMEERVSGTSNKPKSDTILHTIRSLFDDDSDYSLKADCQIDYLFSDQREFPTVEGNMQIQVHSKVYTR
jgi:hypothetical protein